jgi:hypothetical protein
MINPYFPNRDGECVISSLANLILVQYNDKVTAKNLYAYSRQHPLVLANGGTLLPAIPQIVKDLSKNKYRATLCLTDKLAATQNTLAERVYTPGNLALYQLAEQTARELRSINNETFAGSPPVLIATESLPGGNHVYVYLGENNFISNGKTTYMDPNMITIDATVQLEKI